MGKPPSGFMGLQHIAIKVHDIDAAIDFYVTKLGFTVSEIYPPAGSRASPSACASCGAPNSTTT